MRTIASICKLGLLIALALIVVAGCGKILQKEPQPEQPTEQEQAPATRFDPLALDDDKLIVPAEYPQPGDIVLGQAEIGPDDNMTDSIPGDTLLAPTPPSAIDTLNSQAFRVQLYTTKVYGDARYQVRVAEEIFDRPVFLEYEVPYFKIRVGSFGNRDQADDYLMRAKTAGFTDAWVVAVTVNVREAQPLYRSTGGTSDDLDSALVDSLIEDYEKR